MASHKTLDSMSEMHISNLLKVGFFLEKVEIICALSHIPYIYSWHKIMNIFSFYFS